MKKIIYLCFFAILIIILSTNDKINAEIQQSKLSGKNIVFLGDSLTSNTGVQKYINYVENMTGVNCINYGVGGSTVAKIESNEQYDISFIKRYKEIIKNYPDKEYWDFIVIFGGINDYAYNVPIGDMNTDNTTFYGALNQVVYQLQSYYPKARIVIMTPLISTYYGTPFDYVTNGQGVVLEEYRKIIREVAKYQSCAVLETSMLSNLNPNNGSVMVKYYDKEGQDGIHPNTDGHKRIAIPLKNLLENLTE